MTVSNGRWPPLFQSPPSGSAKLLAYRLKMIYLKGTALENDLI